MNSYHFCCCKHFVFLTATIKVHYFPLSTKAHHLVQMNTPCLNTKAAKHLYNSSGGTSAMQKEQWHSVCQPCLWVFTPEPNCVWHLFQTDLFGPGGISGREVNRSKMRRKDVRRVMMGKPMIDIPISHLTRWGQGSDNELWHINELV